MTDQQHNEIIIELRAIRDALAGNKQQGASQAAPVSGNEKTIPMPDELITDAESVEVHFGKNKGVPLGQLQARSLEWYASEQSPKLDRNGNPFPPRAEDVRLKNAARTIYHQRRGTIPTKNPVLVAEVVSEENIPF